MQPGDDFARNSAALRNILAATLGEEDRAGWNGSDGCATERQQSVEATTLPQQDRQEGPLEGIGGSIERLYWGLLVYQLLPPERATDGGPTAVEEALGERLKLRSETRRLMRQLQMLKARLPQLVDPHARPSATVALLDQAQPHALLLLSLLESDPLLYERLHCYTQSWRHIHPSLNGRDLRQLGLPPGPLYGQILRRLRTALLDGEIEAGAEEWQLAEEMIREKLSTA